MTISTSTNFSINRNDICKAALRKCGALGADEAMSDEDLAIASFELNLLLKHLQNQPVHVWKREEATLFLQKDQERYDLSLNSSDHFTDLHYQTAVTTTVSSGTSLVVDDASDMTIADYIGVVLDDGSLFWTTITNIVSSTITLNSAITSTATAGNRVYAYTTKSPRPISILDIRRRDMSDDTDIQISALSYEDYFRLPNKTQGAYVSQYMYNRKINKGELYVWGKPENVDNTLKITYNKPISDVDVYSDEPDVPQDLYMMLIYQLAVALLNEYPSMDSARESRLRAYADRLMTEAMAFDQDMMPIKLKPKRY